MHTEIVVEVTAIVLAVFIGIWRWSALTTRVDVTMKLLVDTMGDHGKRITTLERERPTGHIRALRNGNHGAGRSRVETDDDT